MKETFLSRFTPSMMAPEALEALFVQREELAQRIVNLVRDSALTSSKHHTLLIGPRGIGKTHLIALVYHRLQAMEDLRNHLLIAWLREEEWGVTSFMDLLLRTFRALLAEYDDPGLAKQVEALYGLPLKAGEHAGGALLKEFVNNRTLLVLVENLDDLFEGLGDEGQKRLRAYLQENPLCTLLATAQSLFNGIARQTSPFYGFFRIHHLEELDFDGAARLLANIAKYVRDDELASFIQTPTGRARIRAVHHLAGGNHRVYVIFSEFLTRESLDDLVEPFIRTLDNLTPYYQARMSWLSAQQRKIMEFLCDRRGAVPVKEIAQRCFMTHQTASSQLKDLREKGYVRSESVGRESYYELREPLMRLCIEIKKNRGEPIRLFVDFLRLWYSRAELQRRLELLRSDAAIEREYLVHALRLSEEEKYDPRAIASFRDYKAYFDSGDFDRALQAAEELVEIIGNTWAWAIHGGVLSLLGRVEEALVSLNKALEMDPDNAYAWYGKGLALGHGGRYSEALASFDKAVELEPMKELAWYYRGRSLGELGRYDDALFSLDKAIKLNPNNPGTWTNRGWVLVRLGRWKEALVSFDKVINLDPNDTVAWSNRGSALGALNRFDEALASCDKAIELDVNNGSAWFVRGLTLNYLGRHEETLKSCDKAIELGKQSPAVCYLRVEALLALNRWEEGREALDDALRRFAHSDKSDAGDAGAILRNLLRSTRDKATLQPRVKTLIDLYNNHQVLSALGQGLVESIPALTPLTVNDTAARMWLELWRELAGDRKELELPLRLLDAAIRYRETHDPRILLELPVEERTLLEPLLGTKEPAAREPEHSSTVPKQQGKIRSRSRKKPRT